MRRLAPISDPAAEALVALLEVRDVAPSAWLLQAGQTAKWGYFVVDGLVRELYIDEQGEEHTRAFAEAGQFTGSLLDLLTGQPSVTWVQALEHTRVLALRYAQFEALCLRWPELHLLARRIAEQLYVRKAQREHQFLAQSAATRYAHWRGQHAALEARISQRVLASYLGITAEHLSRLRRAATKAQAAAVAVGVGPSR